MLVYEGAWMRPSLQHGANDACGVGSTLLGGRGKSRDRLAVPPKGGCRVSDGEHVGPAWDAEIRFDLHATGRVRLSCMPISPKDGLDQARFLLSLTFREVVFA